MVAKATLKDAKSEITAALRGIFEKVSDQSPRVHVYETEWGHLRALIGHDGFRSMSPVERQENVWAMLREVVDDIYLAHLAAVHPMDIEEYELNVGDPNTD